jgi:RNA polymerase sigma-70 factor (ECF subfamily)
MMDALMTREDTLIRLMKEHQADVWRYLRFLGAEPATADDLAQEVFIELYRNPIEEISRAATAAWLRKAARHRYLNWLRRAKREIPSDQLEAAEVTWAGLTPAGSDARLDALERCLQKLAGRARRAIELRYRDGRREAEVAEQLETSAEAAKALLKRARSQLRECVERQASQ